MYASIASLILGVVMCGAGGSKVAMGARWPVEAASMRAPTFAIPFVPWIEIVTGGLLIAQWQRQFVAVFVAVLLVMFTALIIWNLAEGNRPQCACFGTWSARTLGWRHVVRNLSLILLAVVVWL